MGSNVGSVAPARLLALTFLVGTVLGLLGVVLWVSVVDDDGGDAALSASSRSVADEPDPEPRRTTPPLRRRSSRQTPGLHGAPRRLRRSRPRSRRRDPPFGSGTCTSTP